MIPSLSTRPIASGMSSPPEHLVRLFQHHRTTTNGRRDRPLAPPQYRPSPPTSERSPSSQVEEAQATGRRILEAFIDHDQKILGDRLDQLAITLEGIVNLCRSDDSAIMDRWSRKLVQRLRDEDDWYILDNGSWAKITKALSEYSEEAKVVVKVRLSSLFSLLSICFSSACS